jgi:hypothetical protein
MLARARMFLQLLFQQQTTLQGAVEADQPLASGYDRTHQLQRHPTYDVWATQIRALRNAPAGA